MVFAKESAVFLAHDFFPFYSQLFLFSFERKNRFLGN